MKFRQQLIVPIPGWIPESCSVQLYGLLDKAALIHRAEKPLLLEEAMIKVQQINHHTSDAMHTLPRHETLLDYVERFAILAGGVYRYVVLRWR